MTTETKIPAPTEGDLARDLTADYARLGMAHADPASKIAIGMAAVRRALEAEARARELFAAAGNALATMLCVQAMVPMAGVIAGDVARSIERLEAAIATRRESR